MLQEPSETRGQGHEEQLPEHRVVILGAGVSARGDVPSALHPTGDGRRTLDWILSAFGTLGRVQTEFVAGFGAEKLRDEYPGLRIHHNARWASTGPAHSLSLAPLHARRGTFICYSDIVFRPQTVQSLLRSDAGAVITVDSRWRDRYEGRSTAEMDSAEKVRVRDGRVLQLTGLDERAPDVAEFAGLVYLSPSTAARLSNVLSSDRIGPRAGLPEVLAFLLANDLPILAEDVQGQWAELNAPQDLARFVLGTKAESLERLRPLVSKGSIGALVRFETRDWKTDPGAVLDRIRETFRETSLVVRSSAISEDGFTDSAAGAHLSLLDVPAGDDARLKDAIERVFASYHVKTDVDQVLVQEMLRDVALSGVVMTRTHSSNAPYYVFNYDDTTSRTDTVTSGEGRELKTHFVHRTSGTHLCPDKLKPVLGAVREIESLVGHDSLDIEFAMLKSGEVFVLQVRPIAVQHVEHPADDLIESCLEGARSRFLTLQTAPPQILGSHTSLSVMSDWNPAEIIGTKPGQLAFSLYRYLITDETWAVQRAQCGYRDVRPAQLLVDLVGHPYVDVRTTFNSFVPASVPDDIAGRLLEYYLDTLRNNPTLHDKIEFDIVQTCWTFDVTKRAELLESAGFNRAEVEVIEVALAAVTQTIIDRASGDVAALDHSQARFERIQNSGLDPLDRVYLHLENARSHGALHFAHLARAGFVAASLIRSLTATQVIEEEEAERFLGSLSTVSSKLQEDAARVKNGSLAFEDFVRIYGHLRPGTYDVTSPRYDSEPDDFLKPLVDQVSPGETDQDGFEWSAETMHRLERALEASPLDLSIEELHRFLRTAIEGREFGKFIFTRDLSAALEDIARFGSDHFINRQDLAEIHIMDLLSCREPDFATSADKLFRLAEEGRERAHLKQSVALPDQIFNADEIVSFLQAEASPNFVTRKKIQGAPVVLTYNSSPHDVDLRGRIVMIPSADPGFDWIFGHEITGLLTMYGGANSHMAIRMAEFQLPGATGIGEPRFKALEGAEVLLLDCAARTISVIR